MKLLSWNYRRLGRPSVVRSLRGLVNRSSPQGLFLIETKANLGRMESIARTLKFQHKFIVEACNCGGGLALLWKDDCGWDVIFSSRWIIGVHVLSQQRFCWNIWSWAIDLGFIGHPFTSYNKRGGQANIKEHLDPALVSPEWHCFFDRASLIHLTATRSDHVPILLCLVLDHEKAPRPFRFLEAWIHDPTYEQVINTAWMFNVGTRRRISLTAKIQHIVNAFKKSRELWLRAGDRNSKFFYAFALLNRRRTFIATLKKDEELKILAVIKSMNPTKAPGPDALNQTLITLIPKINPIPQFNHIRLINLCNMVYKVIPKLLANCIRPLLHKLISPNQTAFISGRWIGENSILINEIVHSMKKKKRNVVGRTKAVVKGVLSLKELPKDAKYLGNPLFLGIKKSKDYEDLKKKVESKLQGWKANLLSQLGRCILVKSVITAAPVYALSTCKLPLTWCRDIDKLARTFFWRGNAQNPNNFIPAAWNTICKSKLSGGLGICKI
nr:uncharacterized protein LOC125420506 [Ziziphus jujuba var. spinosa]